MSSITSPIPGNAGTLPLASQEGSRTASPRTGSAPANFLNFGKKPTEPKQPIKKFSSCPGSPSLLRPVATKINQTTPTPSETSSESGNKTPEWQKQLNPNVLQTLNKNRVKTLSEKLWDCKGLFLTAAAAAGVFWLGTPQGAETRRLIENVITEAAISAQPYVSSAINYGQEIISSTLSLIAEMHHGPQISEAEVAPPPPPPSGFLGRLFG